MRIIKGSRADAINGADQLMRTIAGEMINITAGVNHFLDGAVNPLVDAQKEYRGYPRVVAGNEEYHIKAASSVIYVPIDFDTTEFRKNLKKTFETMFNEFKSQTGRDGKPALCLTHTIRQNLHTCIKMVLNYDDVELVDGERHYIRYGNNISITLGGNSRNARMTFRILPIDQFDRSVDTEKMKRGLTIESHGAGIFCDFDDICIHNHNANVYCITEEDPFFRADTKIVADRVVLDLALPYPLLPNWKPGVTLRNIDPSRVYKVDFKDINLQPNTMNRTDICWSCQTGLFGEIYALAGPIEDPESNLCRPMCISCMHGPVKGDTAPEKAYFRVFRTTYPVTESEYIDSYVGFTESLKTIMREISTEYKITTIVGIKCIETASYIGTPDEKQFRFSKLSENIAKKIFVYKPY
jgi:hypothetical protein